MMGVICMDDFDNTILTIIKENGGQASTRDIINSLSGTQYAQKKKYPLIKRLETLVKFGYIDMNEGISHRGRKPFIYTLSEE